VNSALPFQREPKTEVTPCRGGHLPVARQSPTSVDPE